MREKNKKFGLIGKKIGYSFSKSFFQKKFKKENILNCSYENFDIKSIKEVNAILDSKNIHGLNVTIPYKESIIEYLDDLDPISEKIGAVNTICFDNKRKTVGYNTDCYGFDITLKPFIRKNLNYKRVKIYKINARKLKKAGKGQDGLYAQTTSTYRIFSRAFCNFVFPNVIERPMPKRDMNLKKNLI